MTIDEWIQIGIENGWAETFCYTHDIVPMNDDEADDYFGANDVCIPTIRVWL